MDREEQYINLLLEKPEKPRISARAYEVKALPFMVKTFAIRTGGGKALAVLAVYMLVEVPCALLVMAAGMPSPWRSCYAKKSSYETISFRKEYEETEEEDDTVFTWECACFEGDEEDLHDCEFYGFLPYEGTAFNVIGCQGKESKIVDNWAYVKMQVEIDGAQQDRDATLTPISRFCDEYSEFMDGNLIPPELVSETLSRLITQRFSLYDVLMDRSSAFANEVFVDFDIIDNRFRTASIARKNTFYPGKFVSCALSGDVAAKIGTFRAQTKKHVVMNSISYSCKYLHCATGEATLIEWAKACLPFKNGCEPIFRLLVFVYSYHTVDNVAAEAEAKENYERCNSEVMLKHFSFLYRAFQVKEEETEPIARPVEAILKIFRPVLSTVYGGMLLSVPLRKSDVCLTMPRFLKVKSPENKYPAHRNGTVHLSVMQTTLFQMQRSPFASKDKICTRSMRRREIREFSYQDAQYCVENYGFMTYKSEDRLPNAGLHLELLDTQILALVLNRQQQVMFSEDLAEFSGILSCSTQAHTIVANRPSESQFEAPNFPTGFPEKTSFRANFEACANMYDCCMHSFLRTIDEEGHADLIRHFQAYKRARASSNYFNFGKGLRDSAILQSLTKIGITNVTEDTEDIELPE